MKRQAQNNLHRGIFGGGVPTLGKSIAPGIVGGGDSARMRTALNRNRNLKTSRAPFRSQAHQGISLFTSAATNKRGFQRVVHGRAEPSTKFCRVPSTEYMYFRLLLPSTELQY